MSRPPIVPVALLLEGRRCLVVGGGPVATAKVRALLDGRALVNVVAPTITPSIRALVDASCGVTWREGVFEDADLDDVRLVITATGVVHVDRQVHDAAESRNLFCNSVDDPSGCSFYMPAVVRRDPVVVSVSTAGASPQLAGYLRRRLDNDLESRLGEVADLLAHARDTVHARGASTMLIDWSSVVDDELVGLVEHGQLEEARERIRGVLR